MTTPPPQAEKVPVQLDDGTQIYVEVEETPGTREDVANRNLSFEDVSSALESIVKSVAKPINAAMPTKASVEFGLQIEVTILRTVFHAPNDDKTRFAAYWPNLLQVLPQR